MPMAGLLTSFLDKISVFTSLRASTCDKLLSNLATVNIQTEYFSTFSLKEENLGYTVFTDIMGEQVLTYTNRSLSI